jgi:hypothetical protein
MKPPLCSAFHPPVIHSLVIVFHFRILISPGSLCSDSFNIYLLLYFLVSSNSVSYLPLFYHNILILFMFHCSPLSSLSFVRFQIELCLFMQSQQFYVSAAEKNLHITWRKHDSGAVNITCKAQGVYPEPKMSLYMDNKNK